MGPQALRLLVASFGFALYFGVPVHAVMPRPAEAAIVSFSTSGPGGIAREEDEGDSGDDSGDDGQSSSEDDSD